MISRGKIVSAIERTNATNAEKFFITFSRHCWFLVNHCFVGYRYFRSKKKQTNCVRHGYLSRNELSHRLYFSWLRQWLVFWYTDWARCCCSWKRCNRKYNRQVFSTVERRERVLFSKEFIRKRALREVPKKLNLGQASWISIADFKDDFSILRYENIFVPTL